MRNFLRKLGAVALIVSYFATIEAFGPKLAGAAGDIYDRLFQSELVQATTAADDKSIIGYIKYVGTSQSGKAFADDTGATITLTSGTSGAEAADTTVECPISGAYGGVIDLSNAACDTVGEVADIINSTSGSDWRFIPIDSLRSDLIYSTNSKMLNAAAATASSPDGLAIFWDTDQKFEDTRLLSPFRDSIKYYLQGPPSATRPKLNPNPFGGSRSVLLRYTATSTYGSGTSTLQVISDKQVAGNNQKVTTNESIVVSEAGGATTVAKTLDFAPYGVIGSKDGRLLVRVKNSAANASVTAYPYALWYRYPQSQVDQ